MTCDEDSSMVSYRIGQVSLLLPVCADVVAARQRRRREVSTFT